MKKVLVTGANGYLGRHVVDFLINNNYEVYGVDVSHSKLGDKVHYINRNIFNYDEDIYKHLYEPDLLIHLAWRCGFAHNAIEHMSDLSVHFQFLLNMLKGGLKNLSVMGSMHEVGYYVGCVDEFTPCNPVSQYGIAKNALRMSLTELIKREYEDVSFKWLRGFYISGDDENSNSVFSKILAAERKHQRLFPFNSGTNKYDFLSIDEVAKQISLASLQTEIDGIINCCSGIPVTLAEKVESFIQERNMKIRLDYGKFPDRSYDSPEIYGDTEKIKKILNSYGK